MQIHADDIFHVLMYNQILVLKISLQNVKTLGFSPIFLLKLP